MIVRKHKLCTLCLESLLGDFALLGLLEKQTSNLQEDARILDVKMIAMLEISMCLQPT